MKFADLVKGQDYSYERHGTFVRVTVLDNARYKERRYTFGNALPYQADPQGRSVLCLIHESERHGVDRTDIVPVNKIACTWTEQIERDKLTQIARAAHREQAIAKEARRTAQLDALRARFEKAGLTDGVKVTHMSTWKDEPTVLLDEVAIEALLAKLGV